MIHQENLSEKAWYRLLKVVYIGIWCVALFLLVVISWSNKPSQVSDFDNAYVLCSNGTKYNLVKNNINRFELYYDDSEDSKRVLRACQDNVNIQNKLTGKIESVRPDKLHLYGLANLPLPSSKNYTVEFPEKTVGSWDSVVLWFACGFIAIFAVIETLKTIVLYVLGIHIWRGGLWYGVVFLDAVLNGKEKKK
jgi:hypothetical protein